MPRIVIASPGAGHGKTTMAIGLLAALTKLGHAPVGFKVGPSVVEAGLYGFITGRPGRNLDPVLVGADLIAPLFVHATSAALPTDSTSAGMSIIDGTAGLYDGQLATSNFSSTAHVATLLQAPVVLVIDIFDTSRTVAALVHGLITFDPQVRIGGVILNRARSLAQAKEVASALEFTGTPVLGLVLEDDALSCDADALARTSASQGDEVAAKVAGIADRLISQLNVPEIVELANTAGDLTSPAWTPAEVLSTLGMTPIPRSGPEPMVAVAGNTVGRLRYPEADELLQAAGFALMEFDPARDEYLQPGTFGLLLGGGVGHRTYLAGTDNRPLLSDLRRRVGAGLPTVAEGDGLAYLSRSLDGRPMVGAVAADAVLTPAEPAGYRTAIAVASSVLTTPGQRVLGHLTCQSQWYEMISDASPGWLLDGVPDGVATDTLHGSRLTTHWAGYPQLAVRFAQSMATLRATGVGAR